MGQIVVIQADEMAAGLLETNLSFFLGRTTISFSSLERMVQVGPSDCSAFVLTGGEDEIAVIRALWPGVPIVVYSCSAPSVNKADAFVRFPCAPREVAANVGKFLN